MNTKVVMSTTTGVRMRSGSSLGGISTSGEASPGLTSVPPTAQCARRRPAGAPPGGAHERRAVGPTSLDAPESDARRSWPTERINRRSPNG